MTETLPFDRLCRLDNFGHSIRSAAFLYHASGADSVHDVLQLARRHGMSVALRGAGRSYGDAALNAGQIVLDTTRMNRILDWRPDIGVVRVEPGVTIQQLWKHVIEDGWWPPVVPGTMLPTLGGALAMNIHGKNNVRAGTLGEHVEEFTALLPTGEAVTCTPTRHGDLFHSIIGSAGLLGVFVSITLRLRRIHSGNLRVHAWTAPNLGKLLTDFDRLTTAHDYLVAWVDATARGRGAGRGQLHSADYLEAGADPAPAHSLRVEHQAAADTFLGIVSRSSLRLPLRLVMNNAGMTAINAAKYHYSCALQRDAHYLQPLVGFNFLLDFVPGWERAYGARGMIQHQSFVPRNAARSAFAEIIRLSQEYGMPAYLGVVKRHRRDDFLFSPGIDGYSLALDFKVTHRNRAGLQSLADEMTKVVLEAGGRFYFAKDSTLTSEVAARYLGTESIQRFRALKRRCDPENILQTSLHRRLLRPLIEESSRADTAARIGPGVPGTEAEHDPHHHHRHGSQRITRP